MSDSSPILLIIDPHQSRFSEENEHLIPALTYLQTRYSTVVVATRKGEGPLAIPLASHAVRRTRTQPSAVSALRGVDCSGRQVHVSAPDIHLGEASTVLEMTRRKIDAVFLADLCGSWIHPKLLTAGLDFIRMGDRPRVARAVDCVPRDPSFLPAGDRYALEARLLSGEGSYRALKRALEIVSGSGETMLAGARGLYRPPRGRAVAERRRRRP